MSDEDVKKISENESQTLEKKSSFTSFYEHFIDSDQLELKLPYRILGNFLYKKLSKKLEDSNFVKKLSNSEDQVHVKETVHE